MPSKVFYFKVRQEGIGWKISRSEVLPLELDDLMKEFAKFIDQMKKYKKNKK